MPPRVGIKTGSSVEARRTASITAREAGVSDFYLDGYMGAAAAKDVAEARRRAAAFIKR